MRDIFPDPATNRLRTYQLTDSTRAKKKMRKGNSTLYNEILRSRDRTLTHKYPFVSTSKVESGRCIAKIFYRR